MGITEGVVESVAQKISGSLGPGGTDLEALQGCLLKFEEDNKRLRTSVETFVEWLSNNIPPRAAYREFLSGCLTTLDKQPVVRPVNVGETWRHLFIKCVIRVTVSEATSVCQYAQLCAGLKAGIYGTIHGVYAIWDTKSTMEDWVFLLVDVNNAFNEIN